MVSLVEDLARVRDSITSTGVVQYQFAFALNRRNKNGDRDRALQVILKVSQFMVLFCWLDGVYNWDPELLLSKLGKTPPRSVYLYYVKHTILKCKVQSREISEKKTHKKGGESNFNVIFWEIKDRVCA